MAQTTRSHVLRFVVLFGIVNLFADLTYEGGRSVTGPFLGQLGATAAIVSIVSGVAEFLGYAIRSVSGLLADRTRRYWPFAFAGYAVNMFAVPALALAGSWPAAAALIAAERTGRAIRRPIVQGMLSHAKDTLGGGLVFGINESLDAAGATIGPLVVAWMMGPHANYRRGFASLLVSAVLCLGVLTLVRRRYPHPQTFEAGPSGASRFPASYWLLLAAAAAIGFGFVDFALIAFHLVRTGTLDAGMIPVAYAAAMGVGAIGDFWMGRFFDRLGWPLLVAVFAIGAWCTPLLLLGTPRLAFAGAALWGFSKGAQDTLFKPAIAPLVTASRRTTAFGVFDTGFGMSWLAGSIAFGLLYDRSLNTLVIVSVAAQLLSLPLFMLARLRSRAD